MLDGRIVWQVAEGDWSTIIADARIIPNADIEAAIAQAAARQQADGLVGIYGVQVETDATPPVPVTVRERIRAFGPSVHPDFTPVAELEAHA
nr:DUF2849 domain-containing protein [Gluconacetobacter takamatsuzukensis]